MNRCELQKPDACLMHPIIPMRIIAFYLPKASHDSIENCITLTQLYLKSRRKSINFSQFTTTSNCFLESIRFNRYIHLTFRSFRWNFDLSPSSLHSSLRFRRCCFVYQADSWKLRIAIVNAKFALFWQLETHRPKPKNARSYHFSHYYAHQHVYLSIGLLSYYHVSLDRIHNSSKLY